MYIICPSHSVHMAMKKCLHLNSPENSSTYNQLGYLFSFLSRCALSSTHNWSSNYMPFPHISSFLFIISLRYWSCLSGVYIWLYIFVEKSRQTKFLHITIFVSFFSASFSISSLSFFFLSLLFYLPLSASFHSELKLLENSVGSLWAYYCLWYIFIFVLLFSIETKKCLNIKKQKVIKLFNVSTTLRISNHRIFHLISFWWKPFSFGFWSFLIYFPLTKIPRCLYVEVLFANSWFVSKIFVSQHEVLSSFIS